MTAAAFNTIDYVIFAVLGLSVLLGFLRGLLNEILSLIVWIGAIVVSTLYSERLAAYFSGSHINSQDMINKMSTEGYHAVAPTLYSLGGSLAVLFFGTWLVGTLFKSLVTRVIQPTGASFFNRLLGATFGLARGCLLVIVCVFIIGWTPMAAQPAWQQSRVVVALAPTVQQLSQWISPEIADLKKKAEEAAEQGVNERVQKQTEDNSGENSSEQKAPAGFLQSLMPAAPAEPK
jgi:membrane protein required for colicin V production